jgi:hypothetical protein
MASVVFLRLKLSGCELWKANGAGSLQRKACYRNKGDNSHHPTNHRTKTHVLLSLAYLESRFYCMAASAANSPVRSRRGKFYPGFVKRILLALAGGHLCPPENLSCA